MCAHWGACGRQVSPFNLLSCSENLLLPVSDHFFQPRVLFAVLVMSSWGCGLALIGGGSVTLLTSRPPHIPGPRVCWPVWQCLLQPDWCPIKKNQGRRMPLTVTYTPSATLWMRSWFLLPWTIYSPFRNILYFRNMLEKLFVVPQCLFSFPLVIESVFTGCPN